MRTQDENQTSQRCPQCHNFMRLGLHGNGAYYMGQCRVCKSAIQIRQPSPHEKLIRIIPASAN